MSRSRDFPKQRDACLPLELRLIQAADPRAVGAASRREASLQAAAAAFHWEASLRVACPQVAFLRAAAAAVLWSPAEY